MTESYTIIQSILGAIFSFIMTIVVLVFKKAFNRDIELLRSEVEVLKTQDKRRDRDIQGLEEKFTKVMDTVHTEIQTVKTELKDDIKRDLRETKHQISQIYSHLLENK